MDGAPGGHAFDQIRWPSMNGTVGWGKRVKHIPWASHDGRSQSIIDTADDHVPPKSTTKYLQRVG